MRAGEVGILALVSCDVSRRFAIRCGECFNLVIETGVLRGAGLRNTLEPDPDNTGVGSFQGKPPLID